MKKPVVFHRCTVVLHPDLSELQAHLKIGLGLKG